MAGTGARRPNHPLMHAAQARTTEALDLRLKGYTYPEIARAMSLSNEGARKAVLRGMEELRTERAETAPEVREQEAARLDRMLQRLEHMAEDADDASTLLAVQDRMLRIQDRRARLLGLDLQRVELTGAGGGPLAVAVVQRVIVDPTTTARVIDAQSVPDPEPLALPETADHEVVDVLAQVAETQGI